MTDKRPIRNRLFPDLGMGLGLRACHHEHVINHPVRVKWFEAISENYMLDDDRALGFLVKIRERFPIALHGVSLSIASADPLDWDYLSRLKRLIETVEPVLVSDHCSWSFFDGRNLHDLLPVPFTEEAAAHIAKRIQQAQDFLGRRILLENVSSYLTYQFSEMSEWEFLSLIAQKADCGLLLDVNNVYVNSVNHGFDPVKFLDGLPLWRVGQVHLAGHREKINPDGSRILVDTHDRPVCEAVWNLYGELVKRTGPISTMVEWDAEIPSFDRLEQEIAPAEQINKRAKEMAINVL